jgi:HK97 family phage prohead protease
MSDIEFKAFAGMTVDGEGKFDSHASIFNNVDRDDDIMMPGAFKKTLSERKGGLFPVTHMHDLRQVIGISQPREETKGLRNPGEIALDTQLGMEKFKLMQMGALTEWSIGYVPIKVSFDERKGNQVRLLHEVKLIETAILPTGTAANPKAQTLQLKWFNGENTDTELKTNPWNETETDICFMAMRFAKSAGWTLTKAQQWIKEHPITEPGEFHSVNADGEPDISTHEAEVVGLSQALSRFKFE